MYYLCYSYFIGLFDNKHKTLRIEFKSTALRLRGKGFRTVNMLTKTAPFLPSFCTIK